MIEGNRPQLLPGERIVWEGHPAEGVILRPVEILLIPFSLLWGGFAIFWNYQVWNSGPIEFNLFGLPFLIIGIYITIGRWFIDSAFRRRTTYAVTSQRILIRRDGWPSKKTSLEIANLPAVELEEHKGGTGTIRFGARTSWMTGRNLGIWQPSLDPTPQFQRIENVMTVYQLIVGRNKS